MVKVDIGQLLTAIQNTAPYTMPEMNVGTQYIYDNIYCRLSQGAEVRLSQLNFAAFELDDMDSIRDLRSDAQTKEQKAHSISYTLGKLKPVTSHTGFV